MIMHSGSRGASINLEARSLTNWKTSRHCVVTKMKDLSVGQMRDVVTKAGALLILVPGDLSSLSSEEKEV